MTDVATIPGVNDRLRDRRKREQSVITETQLRELTAETTETHLLKQSRRQKASMHIITAERIEALLVRRGWNPMRLAAELYDRGYPTRVSDIERWRRGGTPGPDQLTTRVLLELGGEAGRR
ncbi:MAG: hypothetical protein H0U59_11305 [Gemmatimonadaceae bacterium]|nr:hypothetical protein [Gemmatimonadaceae bacterium]